MTTGSAQPRARWLERIPVVLLLGAGMAVFIFAAAGVASLALGPRLVGDDDVLAAALETRLPGYEQPAITARELDSTPAHRRLYFSTTLTGATGGLDCSGLVIYHYGAPPGIDVSWDTEACRDAAETVRLARKILVGASIRHSYALYGSERSDAVVAVLRSWLAQGLINVSDIPGSENRSYFTQ